ncbi:MAG: N-acetylmuramoyl-L-alanine amidase [Spirochaetales bacterium]|nr:N-acetylmuramoyl-L-alanine amidase [Spirochaetales bacterium]
MGKVPDTDDGESREMSLLKKYCLLGAALWIACAAPAFSEYTALSTLLAETASKLEWNPLLESGVLVKDTTQVVFTVNVPWVIVNGSRRINVDAVRRQHGALVFPESTAKEIRAVLEQTDIPPKVFRVAAIVIDPGHGGKDSGASYVHTINGKSIRVSEKDIVLNLAKKLHVTLKARYPDKVILLTRENDTYIALEDRPYIANTIPVKPDDAIVYISLHANASMSSAAKGFEVWYLTPNYRRDLVTTASVGKEYSEIVTIMNDMKEEEFTRESVLLAGEIASQLESAIGAVTENRKIKEGEWLVVRKAKMPAVLVEVGFVSNLEEATRLMDDAYLQKIEKAIYNGVSHFIEQFEQSKGFTE